MSVTVSVSASRCSASAAWPPARSAWASASRCSATSSRSCISRSRIFAALSFAPGVPVHATRAGQVLDRLLEGALGLLQPVAGLLQGVLGVLDLLLGPVLLVLQVLGVGARERDSQRAERERAGRSGCRKALACGTGEVTHRVAFVFGEVNATTVTRGLRL